MSKNYLSKNDELRKGDHLVSKNGEWKAAFQDDCNFVIYGWKPVWSSDTYGRDGTYIIMQEDCNLVMYNQKDEARWNTNTVSCSKRSRLTLTNEGHLVLDKEGAEIWTSAKSKGTKV